MGTFNTSVLQLVICTVTKDSKLPVTQRNWKVNKKWLRIQTTIWVHTLYSEARHALQPDSILCISSGSHWNKTYLWPINIIIKNYDNKKKLQKLRDYCKNTAMGVYIYLVIFYCSNSIILPCIFWGFYDHMKLMHLGKEFLCYHFKFIYFTLAHSSW